MQKVLIVCECGALNIYSAEQKKKRVACLFCFRIEKIEHYFFTDETTSKQFDYLKERL